MNGLTISHYRIGEKLGEGGMGEVYRAHDGALHRDVALKFLPESLRSDPLARKRFLHEARAAAALDHPYICHINEVGQHGNQDFIVMEYVEGSSLQDRLAQDPPTFRQALRIGLEVAEALDLAHQKGFVHRDLKPANIMLTRQGHSKVMDFGLAKRFVLEPGAEPDLTSPLTQEGTALGTLTYMSPEQLRGDAADNRSDLFSFGIVLFETLTATHPFRKDRVVETISAVLREKPPELVGVPGWATIPLQRVLDRLLAKNPEDRFQSAREVVSELQKLLDLSASQGVPAVASHRSLMMWLVLAALAVMTGLAWYFWPIATAPQVVADLAAVPLTSYLGMEIDPSFSPDGNELAFSWNGESQSNWDIYVAQIGVGGQMRLTEDPAEEKGPVWSPDGRHIAFLRNLGEGRAEIRLIPSRGGTERMVAEIGIPNHSQAMSWSPDSRYLAFQTFNRSAQPQEMHIIGIVNVETGEVRNLTSALPGVEVALGDRAPAFSPDGRTLAFSRLVSAGWAKIFLLPLSEDYEPEGPPRVFADEPGDHMSPFWGADGKELFYLHDLRLFRQGISDSSKSRRQALAGTGYLSPAFSLPKSLLIYVHRQLTSDIYRIPFPDLSNEPPEPRSEPQRFIASTLQDGWPRYSPDGKKILFISRRTGNSEIWIASNDGTGLRQLTSYGENRVARPEWSPDGSQISFVLGQEQPDVFVMDANGGPARQVTSGPDNRALPIWSRDGRSIYFRSGRSGVQAVWKAPISGGEPTQVTREDTDLAVESVDGATLFYEHRIAGKFTVWKMPVNGGEAQPVLDSISGPADFQVVEDGIFFGQGIRGNRTLNFYDFKRGKTTQILSNFEYSIHEWSVSPDRRWVLVTKLDEPQSDLMLVENFR